jgi:hypothetical protein
MRAANESSPLGKTAIRHVSGGWTLNNPLMPTSSLELPTNSRVASNGVPRIAEVCTLLRGAVFPSVLLSPMGWVDAQERVLTRIITRMNRKIFSFMVISLQDFSETGNGSFSGTCVTGIALGRPSR